MKKLWILLLSALLCVSCQKIDRETPEDPNAVADFEINGLTLKNFPFIDSSTSTGPLRNMVVYELLGIGYKWQISWISGADYTLSYEIPDEIIPLSEEHKELDRELRNRLLLSNGSHGAFMNLIEGATDVIIDSRDISRNEIQSAQEQDVEIETKPIAWDALVFIVNTKNKVKSLTPEQIRKIYTGEITNWKEVGGANHEIHPYTRNTDSGSQEKMETLVMGGREMKEWPEMMLSSMVSPYNTIEVDEWAIAYTPYYYCKCMIRDLIKVKILAVGGVQPNMETILRGAAGNTRKAYPFYSSIYAAVRADEPQDTYPRQIYRWLSTPKGKTIINESGYIAL